jgi:hypothetical protein
MRKLTNILTIMFIVLVSMTSICHATKPARTHWSPAGAGGFGAFPWIQWDESVYGRAYLLSDVAGFFVSTDGAQTWSFSNVGNSQCAEADSMDQDGATVAMLCAQGTFRSLDRGANWSKIGTSGGTKYTSDKAIAIKHGDANTIYVGDLGGDINVTTNGGTNWSKLEVDAIYGSTISALYLTSDNRYLFASAPQASNAGIKVYDLQTDPAGGSNIRGLLSGTYGTRNYGIRGYVDGSSVEHVCTTAGYDIACTIDGGVNWTRTNDTASGDEGIRRFDVVFDSGTNNAWYLISHNHLDGTDPSYQSNGKHYSKDSGATWVDKGMGSFTIDYSANPGGVADGDDGATVGYNYTMFNISINPNNHEQFLNTDLGDALLGQTLAGWPKVVSMGAQNQVVTDMEQAPNGWIFISGMDIGIWVTKDYGRTWESILYKHGGTQGYNEGYGGHTWQLELLGTADDWTAGNGIILGTFSSWDTVGTSYRGAPYIMRSADNGVTFTKIVFGPTRCTWSSNLAWGPTDCNASGNTGYPRGFDCASNGTCYIAQAGYNQYTTGTGSGGIFKSTDYGATWSKLTSSEMLSGGNFGRHLAVDPADATGNTFFYAQYRGTASAQECSWLEPCRSTNGTSCSCIGTIANSPSGYGDMMAVYYPPAGSQAFATSWGQIIKSNGWTWFNSFAFVNQNYLNPWGGGALFGLAWNPANTSQAVVSNYPDDNANGSIMWWTDNINATQPVTWQDITGDLPAESVATVSLFVPEDGPNGSLWIGTGCCGVFKLDLGDVIKTKITGVTLRGLITNSD